ncbi:MAG: archease [Phycisphaerales bacterium]|nr:MAG: archease [Phycisphaerales bacterium]
MNAGHWEHYSHPADMGIRGFGATREEAFAQAALAMTAIVVDLEKVQASKAVQIVCEDDDDEMLFWYWLSAVLFEMGLRNMVFSRFEIQAFKGGLKATAWGEPVDVDKHQPAVEVKAATFADLKVTRDGAGMWMAQCVVDV